MRGDSARIPADFWRGFLCRTSARYRRWGAVERGCRAAMVTGWMSHAGPATAAELCELLGVPPSEIDKALLRLEAGGSILRGNFTGASATGDRVVRTPLARPHPSADRGRIAKTSAAGHSGAIHALASALAARRARHATHSANVACWRSCASCRASRRPRTPGNGRFCGSASPIIHRRFSTSFALRARRVGRVCRRIPRLWKRSLLADAA